MSDVTKRLKRDADALDAQSRLEEGTLAAYWRGYAAGLRDAARRVQSAANDDIMARMQPTPKRDKK
jgi:hypothetical protein